MPLKVREREIVLEMEENCIQVRIELERDREKKDWREGESQSSRNMEGRETDRKGSENGSFVNWKTNDDPKDTVYPNSNSNSFFMPGLSVLVLHLCSILFCSVSCCYRKTNDGSMILLSGALGQDSIRVKMLWNRWSI